MKYNKIENTDIKLSEFAIGSWSFGNDAAWGKQDDNVSYEVMLKAINAGVNLIDTAPVYGRGHSEEVVGKFLKDSGLREKVIVATKLGLSWKGPLVLHDLRKKRMLEEIDRSLKRLDTDYIDIYQIHWPDEKTPIEEMAEMMFRFLNEKKIRAVGVSNFSVSQMEIFAKHCPLHVCQPQYSMFKRDIEKDVLPFCQDNDISTLVYGPLHGGILTGKFNLDNAPKPKDWTRNNFYNDLKEPKFSINTKIMEKLFTIAKKYNKTLGQLVLAWTIAQKGVSSLLIGSRNLEQFNSNLGGFSFDIEQADNLKIQELLTLREQTIEVKT